MNPSQKPHIVDKDAHKHFCKLAKKSGLDPDDLWVGRYVDYEWEHCRHVFEHTCSTLNGLRALEFGCNYGATSIVLAALGAKVTAIDINKNYIDLAKLNAERYGLSEKISFIHVADTTQLPFDNEIFDLVSCNSVLEYVPRNILNNVQQEINRVLKHSGLIVITGTSNRIWPKEVHSGKWFVNYAPMALDWMIFGGKDMERGVFPWQILRGFGSYKNYDLETSGKAYLDAKISMGIAANRLHLLRIANRLLNIIGLSAGLVTPSISVTLRKT